MKIILPFLFAVISIITFAQRGQFGMYIPVDIADKNLMPKMETNVGFGISTGYSPFHRAPFFIELKGSWGSYSIETLKQTYLFTNGTQTTVDVSYKSSFNKYLLGTKFMIGHDFRSVRGFITPQIGVGKFKTNIVISDPQDEDDCRALERKTTQKDAGFVYGGEIGAEISLDRIFKKFETENKHKLILSANYLAGFNHFEYVNVRYMTDEVDGTNLTHADADLKATFINVSTNSLHEHKIAEMYYTPLRFIGFNIGYVFNF